MKLVMISDRFIFTTNKNFIKNILAIIGSASSKSSNEKLVVRFAQLTKDIFNVTIFNDLKSLPHFDPELSIENAPAQIIEFRDQIEIADGVLICTPEYVFSLPSGLKNAVEWCVATTIFTDKPLGIITASAHGERTHEELQRIMRTLMAKFDNSTCMLVQGVKGKINSEGLILDKKLLEELEMFIENFRMMIVS